MKICITGVWLRRIGNKAQVLLESEGEYGKRWFLVVEEGLDGQFSHIVEPAGILNSPVDEVTSPGVYSRFPGKG